MFLDKWNRNIRLTPSDRLIGCILEPLIPKGLKPNYITVFRMFLVPPILLFLARENYAVGVPLFLFAAFTDVLDGALARLRRQITPWGILYDPLADKLLIGSVLFLIVLKHINFALGLCLLLVEAFLIVSGWLNKKRGILVPANTWGKAKMVAEVIGIMFLLCALWSGMDLLVDLSEGTLAVALVTAIVSIFSRML